MSRVMYPLIYPIANDECANNLFEPAIVVMITVPFCYVILWWNRSFWGVWMAAMATGYGGLIFDFTRGIILGQCAARTPAWAFGGLCFTSFIACDILLFALFVSRQIHRIWPAARINKDPEDATGVFVGLIWVISAVEIVLYVVIFAKVGQDKYASAQESQRVQQVSSEGSIIVFFVDIVIEVVLVLFCLAFLRHSLNRAADFTHPEAIQAYCGDASLGRCNIKSSNYRARIDVMNRQLNHYMIVQTILSVLVLGLGFITLLLGRSIFLLDLVIGVTLTLVTLIVQGSAIFVERPEYMTCGFYALCEEYLRVMDVREDALCEHHNKCFCAKCLSAHLGGEPPKVHYAGNPSRRYALPNGWTRFGLKVNEDMAKRLGMDNWHVSYHGTTPSVLHSIILHSQLLVPGDTTLAGKRLKIREGHLSQQNYVFTSPSLAYASHPLYATPAKWGTQYMQVAIECRQAPGTFDVQAETIGWEEDHPGKQFDELFDNGELEWFSACRVGIVLTGVLIRPMSPEAIRTWQADYERRTGNAGNGPKAEASPPELVRV